MDIDSLLIKVRTEHAWVFMKLIDVLKESLNEVKIDFFQDVYQEEKIKEKMVKKLVKDTEEITKVEDEPKKVPDKKPKKESQKLKKKGPKKKGKQESEQESESESSESEIEEKPKENTNVEKVEEVKVEEVVKKKNNGGMRIIALDEHKTVLIYIKMGCDQFAEFYVKKKVHSIGIDLIQLHKFMKTIDKESMMTIMIDKDDEQNIIFELENTEKPSNIKYIQKLLDLDDTVQKLPQETNFDISVAINTVEFRKLCNEMSQFSEYVEITCTSKEITFKCQGDSNAYVKTFKNTSSGVRILCTKNNNQNNKQNSLIMVQAIYSLKHLITFGKCVNLCSEMQLFLKNDWPLFIHYTIGLLGKMLVGLTPVDEKTIKRENDCDEEVEKYNNTTG